MPTISVTSTGRSVDGGSFIGETALFQWETLENGDDGQYVEYGAFADRSMQVEGTFGAGGTLLIEGSNNGTNWRTLTDPLGASLAVTAAGIYLISEPTRYVRPRVSAGDGTTDLDASLFARGR